LTRNYEPTDAIYRNVKEHYPDINVGMHYDKLVFASELSMNVDYENLQLTTTEVKGIYEYADYVTHTINPLSFETDRTKPIAARGIIEFNAEIHGIEYKVPREYVRELPQEYTPSATTAILLPPDREVVAEKRSYKITTIGAGAFSPQRMAITESQQLLITSTRV
jgi:hypothetical protein